MQMTLIEQLMEAKKMGFCNSSKLFPQTAELYKNDKKEFMSILIQGKGKCGMIPSVKKLFFTWLSGKIPTQLYPESESICKDIEEYCLNTKVLDRPLFEITNMATIYKVKEVVFTSVDFKMKHFYNLGKMRKMISLYERFVEETPFSNTDSIIDSDYNCGEMQESTSITLTHEDCMQSNFKDEVSSNTSNITVMTWDFSCDKEPDNIDNVKPIGIAYFNDEFSCAGWSDAYIKTIQALQEDYPSIIRGMVGYKYPGVSKMAWCGQNNIRCMESPVEISNHLFLETNLSPIDIITIIRVTLEKCNVDFANLTVKYTYYKSEDSAVPSTGSALEDYVEIMDQSKQDALNDTCNKRKLEFRIWLVREVGLSCSSMQSYSSAVHTAGQCAVKYGVSKVDLFGIVDYNTASDICDKLFQNSEFSQMNLKQHNRFRSAISKYLEFCKSDREKVSIFECQVLPKRISSEKQKNEFKQWMRTHNMVECVISSYCSDIKKCSNFALTHGYAKKDFFSFGNEDDVKKILQMMKEDPAFMELNKQRCGLLTSAMNKFILYLQAGRGMQTTTKKNQKVYSAQDYPTVKNTSILNFSSSWKRDKNQKKFKKWMEEQHMKNAAILAYLSDIKKCSEFARENGYIVSDFFDISDWQTIDSVLLAMKKDPKFITLNERRNKRPISALHKLIIYCQLDQNNSENTADLTAKSENTTEVVLVNDQTKIRYLSILEENFEDGFRFGKTIDKNRFRIYYSEKYGQDLEDSDEQLVATLMSIGSVRDDRIFVNADSKQSDILSEIVNTVISTFSAGASCIYLDCLFDCFQDKLVEDLHIYSVEALETVILAQNQRNYFKKYGFLCCGDREPDPQGDVTQYMRNSLSPVSYSTIEKDIWFIPLDKIKQILINTPEIVNVDTETYFYTPNLPVSEVELQKIAELIHKSLLQRSYISDVELTDLIEEHLPSVIVNTADYPMWGRRNALAYLLRDKFSFRGAIISNKGEELSMSEVFVDFCKRMSHLSLDELKAFANELQTCIYWDSVYSEMIRINQHQFVNKAQIQFDTNKIDDLLDNLISGKYLSLKSINNLFLHFPALTIKWNGYVLESFLVNYSKKFCLLHASFSATDCCGAIVRRSSGFSDYRALIVDVLAQNTDWINKTDALQLLVDDGYQQRRSYKDIENVMLEANLLREQVAKK